DFERESLLGAERVVFPEGGNLILGPIAMTASVRNFHRQLDGRIIISHADANCIGDHYPQGAQEIARARRMPGSVVKHLSHVLTLQGAHRHVTIGNSDALKNSLVLSL